MNEIIEHIDDIVRNSSFLKRIDAIRSGGRQYRPLTREEIARLESQGNRSLAWDLVRVHAEFTTEHIFDSGFSGECRLGRFDGTELPISDTASHSSGVYRSLIMASTIGDNCLVRDAGMVANCHIGDGAVVFRVGELSSSNSPAFGNGRLITVGNETGGRDIASCAELTLPVAVAMLKNRGDAELKRRYSDFISSYTAGCSLGYGVVDSGARVMLATAVRDSFIGNGVHIDGATLVENCTVLGGPDEKTYIGQGAIAKNSCIQWGCEVTSMAIVDNSILAEHSRVERHGKATNVILGPNSGIAEGEATSSLIGPFVGFHHQSMLIAALWPEGKGNIGYGANIGSNHTSRAPDQELWCGEGVFFGLGTNIKFPANYVNAPYSIIATAVITEPQRVDFPFSLIARPYRAMSGIPNNYNEIMPGWVLAHNLYSILRNERKYRERNRARRNAFDFRVFRPDTVAGMISARNSLAEAVQLKEAYTEKDIPGAGKNFMTEKSRVQGIETYTYFIRYYALTALEGRLSECVASGAGPAFKYAPDPADPEWEFVRGILATEGLDKNTPKENMRRLIDCRKTVLANTVRSKERDDLRGRSIIDDYDRINVGAGEDIFIREMREETQKHIEKTERLIERL
ncbi:MAG TPA: DUF4954 family protein [Spirochaetota bacterium]|nr:MAG: Glucose-1-phosphate adenylyltransferase [Spirochaetes bacterium ADurb.BinA120]HPI15217.1 DUF4954 family protein [Spirochaetota bacterium]